MSDTYVTATRAMEFLLDGAAPGQGDAATAFFIPVGGTPVKVPDAYAALPEFIAAASAGVLNRYVPAPQNLAVVGGSTVANLTWTAVAGATGYKVYRATVSGGPYTLVGSPSPASFGDTGLTNGVTYYYVVKATNVTDSANSAEVSVTPA